MTAKNRVVSKLVDVKGLGVLEEIPVEFKKDIAPEDDLLKQINLNPFPDSGPDHYALLIMISPNRGV